MSWLCAGRVMRRAARVDRNHPEIVSALCAVGCSVLSLASLGGGIPDLLIFSPRRGYVLLEIKDGSRIPSQRRLTDDQRDFHATWTGPISVVTSVKEALAAAGFSTA